MAIIKLFEGLGDGNKLTKGVYEPYQDTAGVWTIGYGSTVLLDGSRVNSKTPAMTEAECSTLLYNKLPTYEAEVNLLPNLNQNQYDACVSLCYNIGPGAFAGSTIFKTLKAGGTVTHDMWTAYSKYRDKNKVLLVSPGLLRRREMEWVLFTSKFF